VGTIIRVKVNKESCTRKQSLASSKESLPANRRQTDVAAFDKVTLAVGKVSLEPDSTLANFNHLVVVQRHPLEALGLDSGLQIVAVALQDFPLGPS